MPEKELDTAMMSTLDPTSRTMVSIREAIAALRNELEIRAERVTERFVSLEKSVEKQHEDYARFPTQTDKAVLALRAVVEEKLQTVHSIIDGRIDGCREKFISIDRELRDLENAQLIRISEVRDITARVGVTESLIMGQKEATALALSAQTLTVDIAQQTAERAVAKSEAAADKVYLESQNQALKENFQGQISSTRDALEAGSKAQREALDAALASSERAIAKAEASTEKRFEAVNEFRQTLADQQKNFATNSEVYLRFTALEEKVNTAFSILNEAKGRASGSLGAQSTVIAFIVAGVAIAGLIFTILNFSLKKVGA